MNNKQLLQNQRERIITLLKCDPDEVKFFCRGEEMKDWQEYYSVEKNGSQNHGYYEIKFRGKTIASWKLYEMPHCCAFLISCNAFVLPSMRNLGIGTLCNTFREEIAKTLGYTAMLCTDMVKNDVQRKILAKNGWTDLHKLLNKRTGNEVFLSLKTIS